MNGKAFCFYISWKNLCEIKINEIHCEDIIIGLISNSKQMESYSDFYTSSFVSFGNFFFFGVYPFCLHFKFFGIELFILSFYNVCRTYSVRSLIPDIGYS